MNTAINIKGIETTARVDMFFFVVEIGIVLIIVIGGLKYVLGGGGAGELTMTPIYQADKVNSADHCHGLHHCGLELYRF